MTNLIKKISGGKLLKLDLEIEQNKISKFKLRGDFFIYPEEFIEELEERLTNKNKDEAIHEIEKIFNLDSVEIIGFSEEDLTEIINEEFEK